MSFKLADGVFPTMITPFLADGAIDWKCVDALVDWYIASGVSGIFSVCQSSEMYNLTSEERLSLARRVVDKAAGRVPVVASGTFGGPVETQASFVREMGSIVSAVVILTNQFASQDESDTVWQERIQSLIDLTPGISLGFYECPVPYKRVLSPQLLSWAKSTGRFLFHKDTCCSTSGIQAKLQAIRQDGDSSFGFYNANVATLQFSLKLKGSGFSGISANFYPQLLCWLCVNFNTKQADEIQDFLSVFENVVMYKYPTSAKIYLSIFQDFPITSKCRAVHNEFDEEELLKLSCLHHRASALCASLGLPVLNPADYLSK